MSASALQKHWMVKTPPSKIYIPPTFQYYLENPASLNACFNLFPTLFFISNFEISLNLTPVVISWLVN